MIDVTIVGAGIQGARMAGKYKEYRAARIRALIGNKQPTADLWKGVPFFVSAKEWKKSFGKPSKKDVFDMNVHQNVLPLLMKEFIKIGAKNFILPKPIALTQAELATINKIAVRYKLNILIASQWHYSACVPHIAKFIKKNKNTISVVEVVFSRLFEGARQDTYTPMNAFLPHMLQLLIDLKLVSGSSIPCIESISDTNVCLHYAGDIKVRIVSDLRAPKQEETLKIFLKGEKTPSLIANFVRTTTSSGSITYPSIIVDGKKRYVREDVLEVMVGSMMRYFNRTSFEPAALKLKAYEPVAQQLVRIAQHAQKTVAVIGGGIFGILSALEIAKKGYPVVIFEKEPDIFLGASLVNQCRVHMGYHYPRDTKTAKQSIEAKKDFEKMFASAIRKIDNYYMVARSGSLINAKEFKEFCRKMKLPYTISWPKGVALVKSDLEESFKVPETIFDAKRIRQILHKKLKAEGAPLLLTSTKVVGIDRSHTGFDVVYEQAGKKSCVRVGAIINAAYSGSNYINKLAGLPLTPYQYELCEMIVVRPLWGKSGWSVIDGPFFGAMPFGFAKECLLYDVEFSVLKRSVGTLPAFSSDVAQYDSPECRLKRFAALKKKWSATVPEIKKAKYLYSLYTTRCVLSGVEKTDARPTMTHELMPGMWHLFSGKITTSIPQAKEVAKSVDAFFATANYKVFPTSVRSTFR